MISGVERFGCSADLSKVAGGDLDTFKMTNRSLKKFLRLTFFTTNG